MLPASLHRGTARASILWGFVLALVVLAALVYALIASPGVATILLLIGGVLVLLVVESWIFMVGR